MYVRAKNNGADSYLYLVKSVWNKEKNTSTQEIIKYLGKATRVVKEDIPKLYRDDPKIISALAVYNPHNTKVRENLIKKSKEILYQSLLEGDTKKSDEIFKKYSKSSNASDFFDKILRPIMYKIGDEWEVGKVSIVEEHVASNIAQRIVKNLAPNVSKSKGEILICVPFGEDHRLGCDILETFFSIKGFKVFNMGSSVPAESILRFIKDNNPSCVLISVTLDENLIPCERLVKKIRNKYDIPIFVGGYALQSKDIPNFDAEIIQDMDLEVIFKKIKKTILVK